VTTYLIEGQPYWVTCEDRHAAEERGQGFRGESTRPSNGDLLLILDKRALVIIPHDEKIECLPNWIAYPWGQANDEDVGWHESDGASSVVAVHQFREGEWVFAFTC
jgi:hypothetical protein